MLIKVVKTNKRREFCLFFVLCKVVTSLQGVFIDHVTLKEAFQGLRVSTSQRNLDTITFVNGKWGDDLSRYQPDNEVWTQPWEGGWSCWEINKSMKSGCKRNCRKEAGVYESKDMAVVFFLAFLTLGRFGLLLVVTEERSHSFAKDKNDVLQFNLRALVHCIQLVQKIVIILFSYRKKIFYNAEHLNRIAFFYFLSESNISGARSRWQNTRALSLSCRVFSTYIRSRTDRGR